MTSAVSSNPSFLAALEKILDGERVVLATVIAQLRIICSGIAALVIGRVALTGGVGFSTSVVSATLHLILSVIIWRVLKTGRLVKRAGWVVPLFDVPIVAIAQIIQTPRMPEPLMGMVNTPAMMLSFMCFR